MSNPKHSDPSTDSAVEDIILTLQKSFSRVSARSATVANKSSKNALSLISGPVSFTVSMKVRSEKDKLIQSKEGDIDLNFSGTINQDVRIRPEE